MKGAGIITQLSIINENIYRIYNRIYKTRPMIQSLKSRKNLIGVEIGVSSGHNAENILKHLDIDILYLIDPYKEFYNFSQEDMDNLRTEAHSRLSNNGKTVFIEKPSSEAIDKIPMVDFVYIDGDHSYKFVSEDIKQYWSKIKPNGVIGGHDFDRQGVMRAVGEFADYNNLDVNFCLCDWWIKKLRNEFMKLIFKEGNVVTKYEHR